MLRSTFGHSNTLSNPQNMWSKTSPWGGARDVYTVLGSARVVLGGQIGIRDILSVFSVRISSGSHAVRSTRCGN